MTIRGVIFDMDGTITAPYLDFTTIKAAANVGDRDLVDYLRDATGAEHERIHRLLTKFEADGVARARLNRGARAVLAFLARQRLPTGLLTRNSRRSVAAVCRKLRLRFDLTITREDGPHKPAPEPIWSMAEQWGLPPHEVLMVGDYKWDVLCARNAGARSAVLIDGAGMPDWAGEADFIIHRLTELMAIVQPQ